MGVFGIEDFWGFEIFRIKFRKVLGILGLGGGFKVVFSIAIIGVEVIWLVVFWGFVRNLEEFFCGF